MRKWIVFFDSEGKEILRMSMKGLCEGEIPAIIGLLAYERGIPKESVSFAEMTR